MPTATMPAATSPSPTEPPQIQVGGVVRVTGTEGKDLRLRETPSLGSATLRLVKEGTVLQVVEGPVEADGYVWWKVRDQRGQAGWAAGNWLAPHAGSP
ncbi:MAG: SH3 domain-containing protein [Anaerolineae bacterium]